MTFSSSKHLKVIYRSEILVYQGLLWIFSVVESLDTQKKTFMKWINSRLTRSGLPVISDVFKDLRDGAQLLSLLGLLSGRHLVRLLTADILAFLFPVNRESPFFNSYVLEICFLYLFNIIVAVVFLEHIYSNFSSWWAFQDV